jgi:glucose/arabinose dehydrogenase
MRHEKTGSMRIVPFLRGVCATALIFVAAPAIAQIQLVPVVSGLSSPLFVGHAGDGSGRLFIVEQGGVIKVLQPGSSTPTVFLNITSRVLSGGERGLLGLAFHPLYASNRRFFVFYTQQTDGELVIAEYLASATNPNVAGTTERRILQIPHPRGNHNGGMLAFGEDGYLYIGVGDGGGAYDPDANAQNLNSLLGKLLRIDVDQTSGGNEYASPSDNPFVFIEGRDEIYSYGLRNPWRFSFDRQTGEPWVGDVGQGAREEVDTPMVSGGNYGWPILEGTICTPQHPGCSSAGTQLPLFEYTHSGGRCSLTGGYVYRGSSGTMPSGRYVYGDYCTGEIFSWNGSQQALLLNTAALISSFGEDEQGELYVVDLNGSVSRIVTSTSAPHITTPTPSSTLSGATQQFAWSAGTGVSTYWLYVGSSLGAADIFNQNTGTSLSATVSGIPTDGRTIHVRLWWLQGGWFFADFQFTAATGGSDPQPNPQIATPPPGSTLTGPTQQFTWSAGTATSRYWLYLGSSQGAADIYNADQGSALSATVSGIPTDGRTLHARLWWLRGGYWEFADFQFTAAAT